jgi:hypothetical protein
MQPSVTPIESTLLDSHRRTDSTVARALQVLEPDGFKRESLAMAQLKLERLVLRDKTTTA